MVELRNKYPAVNMSGTLSYGGSQLWAKEKTMRQCGCGVIACADVLLYLSRFYTANKPSPLIGFDASLPISCSEYEKLIKAISPRYFPLIPRFGINGISLVLGLKLLLRRENIELKVGWGVKRENIIPSIEAMLRRDIPVILSVGPNFPLLLGNNMVGFYWLSGDGQYRKALSIRSHYVVVTGMDDTWLQLSSWGIKYYMRIDDYLRYIDEHSSPIVTNIVNIQ